MLYWTFMMRSFRKNWIVLFLSRLSLTVAYILRDNLFKTTNGWSRHQIMMMLTFYVSFCIPNYVIYSCFYAIYLSTWQGFLRRSRIMLGLISKGWFFVWKTFRILRFCLIKLKGLNWKGRAIILIIRVIIKRAKYICLSDSFTELIAFGIYRTEKIMFENN